MNERDIDYSNLVPSEAVVKAKIRARIRNEAGDAQSLLGTASDVAALGLLHDMATIVAEAKCEGSFETFLRIKHGLLSELAGSANIAEMAEGFLNDVKSGAISIPLIDKGLAKAMTEIAARSDAVAKALRVQDV